MPAGVTTSGMRRRQPRGTPASVNISCNLRRPVMPSGCIRSPGCQTRMVAPPDSAAGARYAASGSPVSTDASGGRVTARQVASQPSRLVTASTMGPKGSVSRNSPPGAG